MDGVLAWKNLWKGLCLLRNVGIELLRGLASFGIVGCHITLLERTQAGACLLSLCDLHVGMFAAISGFLMASGRSVGWDEYAKKRAVRILPTYVVWSVVFLVASAVFQYIGAGAVKPRYGELNFWTNVVFRGGSSCHLWFLICLFYAQCLMGPVCNMKKVGPLIFLAVGFCLVVLSSGLGGWYGNYPLRLLGFLVTGIGIRRLSWPIGNGALFSLVVIALILHSVLYGRVLGFLLDWLVVCPVVILFSRLPFESARWIRVAQSLGCTSMGVYLIHPLFTAGIGALTRKLVAAPYGAMPIAVNWIACWGAALLLAFVLLHIPKVNRFVR